MDTGGQEIYNAQNRIYYKRADCCLLVYDITNQESFDAIENYYINEINNNCVKKVPVILLGNKTDLKNERKITHKEGADLASKYNFTFMETSCEENYNVANAFETIIIMTNTEMKKNNNYNVEKIDMETFKLKNNIETYNPDDNNNNNIMKEGKEQNNININNKSNNNKQNNKNKKTKNNKCC